MRRTLTTLLLTCVFGISSGAVAFAASPQSCTTTGYTKNCTGCIAVPHSGQFVLRAPHTHVDFKGSGSAGTAGTKLCLAKVAAPKASLKGTWIRVSAHGSFKPLKLKHGTLSSYNPSTGKLTRVASAKKAGVYQVV
jgi:hypothetical protein